jgi:hypothetical protein
MRDARHEQEWALETPLAEDEPMTDADLAPWILRLDGRATAA